MTKRDYSAERRAGGRGTRRLGRPRPLIPWLGVAFADSAPHAAGHTVAANGLPAMSLAKPRPEPTARQTRLSPRQRQIMAALLRDSPEFAPPNPPISLEIIATALGIAPATVKEHMRRLRRSRPDLYGAVMEHRRGAFAKWHAAVAEDRRERSRRWGRRRWAARYRAEHGSWPWDDWAKGVHRPG